MSRHGEFIQSKSQIRIYKFTYACLYQFNDLNCYQAAKEIFQAHNTASQLANGIVDLHGLHVAEMVECVEFILEKCIADKRKSVKFITGSGHHTKGPQKSISRLKPALEDYCKDNDL